MCVEKIWFKGSEDGSLRKFSQKRAAKVVNNCEKGVAGHNHDES